MSCNYLNAELFLLSPSLSPASLCREAFSLPLCLSISHMCFLALSFRCFLPPPPLFLSPPVSVILPSLPPPSCLSLVTVPLSVRFPRPSWLQGLAARAVGAWAKVGGRGQRPSPLSHLPSLAKRGESPLPAAPAWVRGTFPDSGPPRAPILLGEAL